YLSTPNPYKTAHIQAHDFILLSLLIYRALSSIFLKNLYFYTVFLTPAYFPTATNGRCREIDLQNKKPGYPLKNYFFYS
ncbi:MAG: hypothetical protein K2Q14_08610, partial [Gammaproteobacteria bacterium]|nr:hypothetical protein [Gammaproteobacteria bacterium]